MYKPFTPLTANQSLHSEDRELLDKAKAYGMLSAMPAWKTLLDFLAHRGDRLLAEIRNLNLGSSDMLIANMTREWRAYEQVLLDIQNEVLGTQEDARKLLEQIKEQMKGEMQYVRGNGEAGFDQSGSSEGI